MTDPTTTPTPAEPLDLAAIRARVEAATPGPWVADPDEAGIVLSSRNGGWDGRTVAVLQVDDDGLLYNPADAEFIAHARSDVPALLAALDAAHAETERLLRGSRCPECSATEWNQASMMRAERDEARAALAALRERVAAGEASDGYHTHRELYDYRMLYNAHAARGWLAAGIPVVKSWHHSGGEPCFGGGWFIVAATLPTGQVSNHYRAEHWDLFDVPEVALPPEYDGHTPADAADRLRAALAARPAPAVNAADVERAAAVLLADYQQQYDGGQIEEFLDLARAVARALGITVADEGCAEDRIEREGGEE